MQNPQRDSLKRLLKDQTCDRCLHNTARQQHIYRMGKTKPEIIEINGCGLYGSGPSNMTCSGWVAKSTIDK